MRVIMENIGYPTDGNSMGDGEESEIVRNQLRGSSHNSQEEVERKFKDGCPGGSQISSYSNNPFTSGTLYLILLFYIL